MTRARDLSLLRAKKRIEMNESLRNQVADLKQIIVEQREELLKEQLASAQKDAIIGKLRKELKER